MSSSREELVTIAVRRRVRFEVRPDDEVVAGEIVRTALRVDLLAPSTHADGCAYRAELACPAVFADLATIARAVLPDAVRDTSYFLDGFDHALHVDPQRHYRGDVRLTIRVRHRDGSHGPIDACQRRCVEEIRSALLDLGIQRN